MKVKIKELKQKKCRYNYEENTLFIFNNKDSDKIAMNSQFRIGSLSKVLTMLAFLVADQEKKLSLKDTVDKYLDVAEKNKFKKTTILQLLNHVSGLKRNADKKIIKKYKTMTETMKSFISEDLFEFESDTNNYSNIGFIILGSVLEYVYGYSYINIIKNLVLEPLGMNDTIIGSGNLKLYSAAGSKLKGEDFDEIFYAGTAGGWSSTCEDWLKLVKNIPKLFSNKTIKKLLELYPLRQSSEIKFKHSGAIHGGESSFTAIYDEDWNLNKFTIWFSAINKGYFYLIIIFLPSC